MGEGARIDPPPWPPDFPEVLVQTTLEGLYGAALAPGEGIDAKGRSPAYLAAKAGDVDAARRVVEAVIRPEVTAGLAGRYPDATVVAVHAEERSGRNALPETYAVAIGEVAGLLVDDTIVQTNRTWHTGANARQRLARTPRFAGRVLSGRRYIVVDDVVTSGSSLAALRHFIEGRGGTVCLATTLASARPKWGRNPLRLAIEAGTIAALEEKFDRSAVDAILQHYGTAPSLRHLTEAQGRTLLGFRSVDAIRSSIASGGQAADPPAT